MPLTIEDVVTHYVFSSHPRNRAIVDIKNKKTGDMKYIKIRHRLDNFYAVSLVDPVSFEVLAEIQVKSATARTKPIILHSEDKTKGNKVELRGASRIGFEYSFDWEGEKYKWVRESRMNNNLECRAIRSSGDICVAQYLPRTLKNEYFGIFSILGYNMLRCELTQTKELELILFMSIMTLLDKSDDGGWKRDPIGKGVRDDGVYGLGPNTVSPSASAQPEDPVPKKAQMKKMRAERENDQKLNFMMEKSVRKSQKQLQHENDIIDKKKPMSAGNSPSTTPNISPLPTPSVSTNNLSSLRRQKSASNIDCSPDDLINSGKLSRLFSNMGHSKQDEFVTSPTFSANNSISRKSIVNNDPLAHTSNRSQNHNYYYYNQLSFPYGQYTNIESEYGLQKYQPQASHAPSLKSIQWNTEPHSPIQSSSSHVPTAPAAPTTRKPRPRLTDAQRRQSASEYSLYYQQYQPGYDYSSRSNGFSNRYPISDYYNNSAYYQ